MVEQTYRLGTDQKIEKLVLDENLQYIHMLLAQGEGLPEHYANSNVYMTVVRGTLSIGLNDQAVHVYEDRTLLKIPKETKMNVKNLHPRMLELLVVKAPAPIA